MESDDELEDTAGLGDRVGDGYEPGYVPPREDDEAAGERE